MVGHPEITRFVDELRSRQGVDGVVEVAVRLPGHVTPFRRERGGTQISASECADKLEQRISGWRQP